MGPWGSGNPIMKSLKFLRRKREDSVWKSFCFDDKDYEDRKNLSMVCLCDVNETARESTGGWKEIAMEIKSREQQKQEEINEEGSDDTGKRHLQYKTRQESDNIIIYVWDEGEREGRWERENNNNEFSTGSIGIIIIIVWCMDKGRSTEERKSVHSVITHCREQYSSITRAEGNQEIISKLDDDGLHNVCVCVCKDVWFVCWSAQFLHTHTLSHSLLAVTDCLSVC